MKRFSVLAAVVTCLLIPVGSATAAQAGQPGRTTGAAVHSEAAAALKQGMRTLWTDHVVCLRDYIIAAVGDQPDAKAAATRLMKNQEHIGNAVAKFYGAPAGQQLTTL
jgi:hypothetical protein